MTVTELLLATLADRYRVEREIGRGGMATVYLAHDLKHDRKVAVKVLKPELGAVLGVERFLAEIRLTANLQHPNLLPVFDSGETGGLLYYVMPFVEGETLRARLEREKQLPVDDVVHIATLIASALDYAHAHKVIHRDLKPENILLQSGQPIIADFGIALAVAQAGGPRITETGLSLGTPQYMSPEQATGDRVIDARSDQYALGAVVYEMLTGEPPHTGPTSQAIIARLMTEKPRSVRSTRSGVRPSVDRAIGRALSKTPADRFSSCGTFVEALAATPRSIARNVVWAAVGIVSLIALPVALWLAFGPKSAPAKLEAPRARSIAVLPLGNVGGDSTQEYFADGMTEEMTNALGKLPGLRVAARTSAHAFKGRRDLDVKEVGQKLGVDVVLQGSVRRSGDRIRVNVELTDAKQGVELWSGTYDRDMKDVFAVQDSITQATVRQLAISLGTESLAATRAGRTSNVEAHDLYLRGQTLVQQSTETALRHSIVLFQQALAKDPDYALADAGIAFAYAALADAYMPAYLAYDSSRAAARRAIARDSLVGEAHALAAMASIVLDWDFNTGLRELRVAAEREPNSSQTQFLYAISACSLGHTNDALAASEAAIAVDPLNPMGAFAREQCLYVAGRYDQVLAEHARAVAAWPDPRFIYWDSYFAAALREKGELAQSLAEYERAHQAAGDTPLFGYAVTLARAGKPDSARAMLDRMLAYGRDHYVNPITIAAVYSALGDRDRAFAWLDRTVADRTARLWALPTLPEFRPLHADPRFVQLIRRIGLPMTARSE